MRSSGEHGHRGHHDWRTFRRLQSELDTLQAAGGIRYLPDTQVWFVEPHGPGRPQVLRLGPVHQASPGVRSVRAAAVVLCPGGYDRQLPIPGWDLPGVLAAGGIQALLKGHGVVPGRRGSRRRHRSVPASRGDRPGRRGCRGGLDLRGRGTERLAPPSRRRPRCAGQDDRRRRVRGRTGAPPDPVPSPDRDPADPRRGRGRGRHHRPARSARPAGAGHRAGARRGPGGARLGFHPVAGARPGGRCGDPARCRRFSRGPGGRRAAQFATGRVRRRRGDRGRRGAARGPGGRAGRPDGRRGRRSDAVPAAHAAVASGDPSGPGLRGGDARCPSRPVRLVELARGRHDGLPLRGGDGRRHPAGSRGPRRRRPAHPQTAGPTRHGLVPGPGVRLRHRLSRRRRARRWRRPTSDHWPAARSAPRSPSATWPTWPKPIQPGPELPTSPRRRSVDPGSPERRQGQHQGCRREDSGGRDEGRAVAELGGDESGDRRDENDHSPVQ